MDLTLKTVATDTQYIKDGQQALKDKVMLQQAAIQDYLEDAKPVTPQVSAKDMTGDINEKAMEMIGEL